MKKSTSSYLLFIYLLVGCFNSYGQAGPSTLPGGPRRDTSQNKTNNGKWKDEEPNIYYEKLNSAHTWRPDTAIHSFQRNPFTQSWYRDLGNLGSPALNLLFTPDSRMGPSLGYHVFDIYRFNIDSLNYYNSSRPYSAFHYQLGSKLEQTASILHTQNIRPNWNFAVEFRKTNSPGFYQVQRNNNDNAFLTTNYKSLDKHYELYAGMVYNKQQHDENGGIVNDSDLTDPRFTDRKTIDAAYQSSYSSLRSTVTNTLRDYTFSLQHSYRWGRTDTTYNKDSTQYTYRLVPRFSITHKMAVSTEKHTYKDLAPDSIRYTAMFTQSFANDGTGYYAAGDDSVFMEQKWLKVDNQLMLNGFLGKPEQQLTFSAGIGNRYDRFISQPVSNVIQDSLPNLYYTIGNDKSNMVHNYLAGEIRKEALHPGQWEYGVSTKFFFTGTDAGNLVLNALLGKQLKNNAAGFALGFRQEINSATYSYTNYENKFTKQFYTFNKESVTTLSATLETPKLRLSGGLKNYVINNYLYYNEQEVPDQYSGTFNLTQVWLKKVFKAGNIYFDNELVYQQVPGNAPVNIPAIMGRHQITYEQALFKKRLKLATGVEVRYTNDYKPAGYDAIHNQFFFQDTKTIRNTPELSLFLNFRIKRFRAFIMGDNLQQIFSRNTILYTGTPVSNFTPGRTYIPVYAAPDVLIRFGFTWVMIN